METIKNIRQIPTPFLVIDQSVLEKNIHRIHSYAKAHGYRVRPHVKTHKSLSITRMQLAAGGAGIGVAKATEAQALAEHPGTDITVAYPAFGDERVRIIAGLAQTHTVRVAVDERSLMDWLSRAAMDHDTTIGIHVMFDAGLHRCGTADPDELTALARYAQNAPYLEFEGIQLYLGHLYGPNASAPESFEQINRSWKPAYNALCKAGLEPPMVSSGATPSLFNTHQVAHVNELRVGTAYINDYFVAKFNHCALEDCAARMVATVVSDRVPGQVIIDAGSKSLSAKQLLRREALEMGYVCEYPEARICRLHEEHGWVDVSRCKNPPGPGDRISIIPVNAALCMNLFNFFYLQRADGTLERKAITARGCCI